MKTTPRKIPGHNFRFRVIGVNGKPQTLIAKARVTLAKSEVNLTLEEHHVAKSIRLKGVGNTQTCSMAICTLDHASAFPHPVAGFIDWTYRRAYVVSHTSKATGLPTACVMYAHTDAIAKLNDTKGGQSRLLADLKTNGPLTIKLSPAPKRRLGQSADRQTGPRDGSRTAKAVSLGHGAKLRFAVAELGGFDASK